MTKAAKVREYITGQIDSGNWKRGDRVPACSSLGKTLECHPDTVASEVNAMIHDGILVRPKGYRMRAEVK